MLLRSVVCLFLASTFIAISAAQRPSSSAVYEYDIGHDGDVGLVKRGRFDRITGQGFGLSKRGGFDRVVGRGFGLTKRERRLEPVVGLSKRAGLDRITGRGFGLLTTNKRSRPFDRVAGLGFGGLSKRSRFDRVVGQGFGLSKRYDGEANESAAAADREAWRRLELLSYLMANNN